MKSLRHIIAPVSGALWIDTEHRGDRLRVEDDPGIDNGIGKPADNGSGLWCLVYRRPGIYSEGLVIEQQSPAGCG